MSWIHTGSRTRYYGQLIHLQPRHLLHQHLLAQASLHVGYGFPLDTIPSKIQQQQSSMQASDKPPSQNDLSQSTWRIPKQGEKKKKHLNLGTYNQCPQSSTTLYMHPTHSMQRVFLSEQVLQLDAAQCVTLFYLAHSPCVCLIFVIHRFSAAVYRAFVQGWLFLWWLIPYCCALALQDNEIQV